MVSALTRWKLALVLVSVSFVAEGHAAMQSAAARARAAVNDDVLSEVLPAADRFESEDGLYKHVRGYARDAGGDERLVGFAFFNIDLGTRARGYNGVIPILVGLDLGGRITGVKVFRNYEPYGYRSINLPEYGAQFEGKSVLEPFEVGNDIDGYSGATITTVAATRSIGHASRRMAREFLVKK